MRIKPQAIRVKAAPASMVAPDQPASVIEVECDGEPIVDHAAMRPLWPRYKVDISI